MSTQSVLIVTYGRSGSTLLMGILNSINGYQIRGENNNSFYHLYRSFRALERSSRLSTNVTTNPWYNQFDLELLKSHIGRFVKSTLCGDGSPRVYGFKEIRYIPHPSADEGMPDYATFADYLDFLRDIFPFCKILFNTRNLADVIESGWWARHKEESQQLIITANQWYDTYSQNNRDCFQIDYSDVVKNGTALAELFAFLGEEYCRETMARVLELPHSD